MRKIILITALGFFFSCSQEFKVNSYAPPANPQTNALSACALSLLQDQSGDATLLGHQDDLAYGVHWFGEAGRSDVQESAGMRPAMFGWDIGELESNDPKNLDSVPFEFMISEIKKGFNTGSLSTISWHARHPITGGDSWDKSIPANDVIQAILPGGDQHEKYKVWLDRLIQLFERVAPAPIFFRPFHEMNGDWFWWGDADPDVFKTLWWFTFDYIHKAGVNNLLWVHALDSPKTATEILKWYPGDEFVDVVGNDDYKNVASTDQFQAFVNSLETTVEFAQSRQKLAALTETGQEGIGDANWFTGTLLKGLQENEKTRAISWVLLWRNANAEKDRPDHFYAPYSGHKSEADFKAFSEDPSIFFDANFQESLTLCTE